MSIYAEDDEQKIRTQALVHEWQESGFLEKSQLPRLELDLRVSFRRTNPFFRAILFVFTAFIVSASMALIFTFFKLNDEIPSAIVCTVGGIVCWGIAEFLIDRFRLYRFGIEEGLVAASVVLLAIAAGLITSEIETAGLTVAALAALAVYHRFGYRYAAIGSMLCAAGVPFQMHDLSDAQRRVMVAALFALICYVARPGFVSTAAWAGIYIALNLQFAFFANPHGAFYWFTYVAIWVLPIAGLVRGLRNKDRWFTNVSAAMFLTTLATNKPYLGLTQHAWDPILFGLFLIISAVAIKRWLSAGPDGRRYGFTSARLLASDRRILTVAGTASVMFQQPELPASTPAAPPEVKPDFGGGRSGGAGASGTF